MKNIKNIIIAVLAILLWLRGCDSGEGEAEKTTVVDSVVVHITHVDTVEFEKVVPRFVDVAVYTPVYDTLGKTWIYNNPVEDSLISGNIRTTIQDCSMLGQSLTYTPKFPKYIIRTDSVLSTKTITTTLEERKINMLAGVTLTGNNTYFDISPTLGLKLKNGDQVSVGYGLLNKTIQLSLQRRIKFKRK